MQFKKLKNILNIFSESYKDGIKIRKNTGAKNTGFVEFLTIFAKINIKQYYSGKIIYKEVDNYEKRKMLSNKMRNGIKKGLSVVLKANVNSSGCFIIYQPKTPKNFDRFKKIK